MMYDARQTAPMNIALCGLAQVLIKSNSIVYYDLGYPNIGLVRVISMQV